MTKREKTMKGFECCLKSESSDDCVECPYFNGKTDCVRQKNTDALALLKEQEERIKFLERWIAYLEGGDPCEGTGVLTHDRNQG